MTFARRAAGLLVLVPLLLAIGSAALAHPLGNLTSNTYAGITLSNEGVLVDYVLDLAEVPTVQARGDIDRDADGEISPSEAAGYAETRCLELADGIEVSVDGSGLPLTSRGGGLSFPPGEAGLTTLRLECDLAAEIVLTSGSRITVVDTNLRERIGWHEITASGPDLASADVPRGSVSDRLADYPEDMSPLNVDAAALTVGQATDDDALAGFPATTAIGPFERVSGGLTDLMDRRDLTLGFGMLAAGLAIVLGSMHALAPGHGKTVMAAYLVSREGTLGQMLGLGTTVAITHTLGVLVLGILVTTSQALAPERLYPWLGIASGVLFAAVGVWLLMRARRGAHSHSHGLDHDHEHGDPHGQADHHLGSHDHAHAQHHGHAHASVQGTGAGLGWRSLVLPGLAGGMLPSPSALVVLVAGIALGRLGFGLLLVVAYGIGMALTLMGAGWLLVRMRHRVIGRLANSPRWGAIADRLPTLTASAVVLGGLVIAVRSALTI